MTYLESQKAVCRLLDIDHANIAFNGLFNLDDIKEVLLTAIRRVWDRKDWDFKYESKKITAVATDYYDFPDTFVAGTIKFLSVGGAQYDPLSYKSYRKYLEDNSTGSNKYYSFLKRFLFINQNAITVGDEIDVVGQLKAPQPSVDGDLLPFSENVDNQEMSGNDAIVKIAAAELLDSEKKQNPTKAKDFRSDADSMIEQVWQPMADSRANLQNRDMPQFDTPDYFATGRQGIGQSFRAGNFF